MGNHTLYLCVHEQDKDELSTYRSASDAMMLFDSFLQTHTVMVGLAQQEWRT
jgi:hypothetical protein